MLFRRHGLSPPQYVVPPTGTYTERSVPNTLPRTPRTLEEMLAISSKRPKSPLYGPRNPPKGYHSTASSRSAQWTEYRTTPTQRWEPRSKKTGHATIRTDATDSHEAFESDAFAVHMPTTRLPIIENTMSPPKPSPAAQAEAYRTYMEKARQVRERDNNQGVRVPSKIVSHDYAIPNVAGHNAPLVRTISPPISPPTPAGSFPVSPYLPQTGWEKPQREDRSHIKASRATDESRKLYTLNKHAGSSSIASTPNSRYRCRADSEAGASRSTSSPTPPLATIRVRLKPKLVVAEADPVQTESRYSLYTRPSPTCSTQTSRSASLVKSMPNFRRHQSIEGDSIFGYRSKDTGTVAGASSTSGSDIEKGKEDKEMDKGKKTTPKRSLTSRWPWLRPSGHRVSKPTLVPAGQATAKRPSAYIDPFVTHATPVPTPIVSRSPVASRPASPRKIGRSPPPASTGKFDSGFAQIKRLTFLILKIAFSLYAVIAFWFVLDAIREAFHTLGAPFRVMKLLGGFVWIWGLWAIKMLMRMWEKWGFKVALKGGWMWKMRWWKI